MIEGAETTAIPEVAAAGRQADISSSRIRSDVPAWELKRIG
jgi:hypothetical protein